jgi:hypothetical protein
MKTITFRPLRKLKSGKIAVASYAQWRKVKCADRSKFKLILSTEYKEFPESARVFNHLGDDLLWKNCCNPHELCGGYSIHGCDCDGVPAFSHGTINDVYNSKADTRPLEPLTVGVVKKWIGWFLYQLENTDLEVFKI